jgi:hypothetical protein
MVVAARIDAHNFRRTILAKGQMKSNKEKKKPKQDKKAKAAATTTAVFASGGKSDAKGKK